MLPDPRLERCEVGGLGRGGREGDSVSRLLWFEFVSYSSTLVVCNEAVVTA